MANVRRSGFIRGLGGMFSFIDVFNRRLFAESAAEADAEAIYSYWEAVGGYLAGAISDYAWEYRAELKQGGAKECGKTPSQKNLSPE